MKNFFTSFFGALLAIAISFVLLLVIIFSLIPEKKEVSVLPKSVLHLTFSAPITERTSKDPFEEIRNGGGDKAMGLNDIMATIEKAKTDSLIKGIYLDLSSIDGGFATVEEIRNSLLDFKKSGKFIVSYSEIYTAKAYYLATVSDKIYLNPQGLIEWKGLSAQIMFYTGMLKKMDVDVQIFRHGKFKSAVEPFFEEKMSDANRLQTKTYIGGLWNQVLKGVSESRGISIDELTAMANKMQVQRAADCIKYKLADATLYKDELLGEIRKLISAKETDKINFITLSKYNKAPKTLTESTLGKKNKIAVIYASGSIESGEGDDNTIGSERISSSIREARLDSNVKAIVLRVNSPGGSALASDVIWREMVLAKKVKPVIVSMGDVAASGGYYIACVSNRIFAQPNTITGSIGVFGMLPSLQRTLKTNLGITIDTVNTNKHAHLGSLYLPVDKDEAAVIQQGVEDIYTDFITKVGEGRGITKDAVDSIGQGRVWCGTDAIKIGLVDELGGINDAIKYAAGKAGIKDYKILSLPKQKDPFEDFMKKLSEGEESIKQNILKTEFGAAYNYYKYINNMMGLKGIQARLPYEIIIN
jgi:protease-4